MSVSAPEAMLRKLQEVEARYQELDREISDPSLFDDPDAARLKLKEHGRLKPMVEGYRAYTKVETQLTDARELLESGDADLAELAAEEAPALEAELEGLVEQLKELFVTQDEESNSDVIVEITAGVGGDESALFAGDLFRMYTLYAERKHWKAELIDSNEGNVGGYKKVSFTVEGEAVFRHLRFESGGHRVQRVPKTETQGRIHTSMVTVVILPQVEEVDIQIDPKDIKTDTFSASGPGGQHVNKTQSAVRLTHEPTGIVVSCQDEKSQLKNKAKALKVLRARVADHFREIAERERSDQRRSLRGHGMRNERIRTYNFPQDRCTDHRIGFNTHNLDRILTGEIDELIDALIEHDKAEALKTL